jgi:hypothetical protein
MSRTFTQTVLLSIAILLSITSITVTPQARQGGARGNPFAGIDWNKPFPAHKVIGNMYFVGSEQLGSFSLRLRRATSSSTVITKRRFP